MPTAVEATPAAAAAPAHPHDGILVGPPPIVDITALRKSYGTNEVLNGIVIMILFTCVISSLVTEYAAKHIVLAEKEQPQEDAGVQDETVLIPVKYPEYANRLTNLALLMRNPKRDHDLVALSVVYDDANIDRQRAEGCKLLEQVTSYAASADVKMQSQLRVATNIANGIMHAFKVFTWETTFHVGVSSHAHEDSIVLFK